VKLRESEVQGGYFKTAGSSGGSCEVSPLGGFGHPLPAVGGGFGHLYALGGGPATPKGQNPFFSSFFFFWAFWGGRTTPKGLGWLWPPPYGRYGVAEATPWPKMGWSSHPTFGKGVAPATPIPSFFFFFNFLLFFKKKKN
jgi:hypothetical protein